MDRRAYIIVAAVFLAVIVAPGLIQTVSELRHGERPRALDIFFQPPTARNLHGYEQSLEETSLVVKQLRPWMQYLQWRFLADAGEKAVVGRDGWLFYRPSVRYVIERQTGARRKRFRRSSCPRSDRSAISSRRGGSGCWSFRCPTRRASIPGCSPGGQKTRESSSASRRVVCSISWSSAASSTSTCSRSFAVPGRRRAGRIRGGSTWRRTATGRRRVHGWPPAPSRGECSMEAPSIGVITLTLERSVTVRRHGDLVEMLRVPQIERALEPESLACLQVVRVGHRNAVPRCAGVRGPDPGRQLPADL